MMKQAPDIISLPVEVTQNLTDSKFRLVHVAAQRVRQLSAGEPIEVATRSIKDTTIALEESLAGRLQVLTGEDAQKAKEEFQKRQEQARLEEELSAKEEEIRRELSVYLSESGEESPEGDAAASEAEEGEEPSEEEPSGEETDAEQPKE